MTLGAGSEKAVTWRLFQCDPRYKFWGGVSPWRLWTCDPRYRVWEGFTVETGHMTLGAGPGKGVTL